MVDTEGDVRIRKVKVLRGRAREEADKLQLSENDLVIVKTTINSMPKYEIELIEGSAIQYLQKNYLK